MTPDRMREIAAHFERFAAAQCAGYSPSYEKLSRAVAADPDLLSIAAHARAGQPIPNLLFAAARYLGWAPAADPVPSFRGFCLGHRDAIAGIIATRRVQTNEVGRCALLLPAFELAFRHAGGRPLSIVEIGASAGLNLLWDRYRYDYGTGERAGPARSPVVLRCMPRGSARPPVPREIPPVAARLGIDLAPLDPADPDAVRWLEALVWPEHHERARRLRRALRLARQEPPEVIAGDALEILPVALRRLPAGTTACVFHTIALNQFAPAGRRRLDDLMMAGSAAAPLHRISVEWIGTVRPQLELALYEEGEVARRLLARCDAHGRWIEWLA